MTRSTPFLPAMFVGLLGVAACGDGSSSDRASGPEAVFVIPAEGERLAFRDVPFPNDLFFRSDEDGVETLEVGGLEDLVPQFPEVLKQGLAALDGFGTTSAIFFHFDGDLDPGTLPAGPAESVAEGASVFLVDLRAGGGARPRHPLEIRYDANRRRLAITPQRGRPLAERTTYAAVVTRKVLGSGPDGSVGPVQPSPIFRILRDRNRTTSAPRIARAKSRYEDAFEIVAGLPDVRREDIASMALFSTQSITRELTAIRRDIARRPAPQLSLEDPGIARVYDEPAELDDLLGIPERPGPGFGNPGGLTHDGMRAILSGTYLSPWYKSADVSIGERALTGTHDDDRFVSVEGEPIEQRLDPVPVTFVIPAAPAPPGGYPVVIYQHGLGGSRTSMFGIANAFARAGYVVVGIDAVAHGMRFERTDVEHNLSDTPGPDGFAEAGPTQTPVGFFEAFLNLLAIRDNLRQTAVDLMVLVEMIRDPSLDLSAVGSPPLDERDIAFFGNSFGAISGAMFLSVDPHVRHGVLNVAGGGLANYLLVNSPAQGGANIPLIAGLYGFSLVESYPNVFDPFTAISQTILEAGDPVSYARHLIDNPLAIAGFSRNPPKNILQIEAMGDEVVPNEANEHLAVAAGLDLLVPAAAPVPGLAEVPGPIRGNRVVDGTEATAVLIQQSPVAHGSNTSSQTGRFFYVPGFPFSDQEEPFPRLDEAQRVVHPLAETQAAVVRFITTGRAGRAEATNPVRPRVFPR